jgi:cyclophilin family peptidyl-prolyl cis-trans isomerase
MQNYTSYIIGLILIVIIGFLAYSFTSGNKPEERTADNYQQEQQVATTTQETSTTTKTMENKDTYKVTMQTNKGSIVLELDSKIAPKTVANFVKLAGNGFYDGTKFHRVIPGFMIQGGDPLSKDDSKMNAWGTGGPGYKFDDEITIPEVYKAGYKRGILAMANSGPNTNGSQFFIMHQDTPLPPNYTIFGHVLSGLETVDAIAKVKTLYPGQLDRPVESVVLTKVTVE